MREPSNCSIQRTGRNAGRVSSHVADSCVDVASSARAVATGGAWHPATCAEGLSSNNVGSQQPLERVDDGTVARPPVATHLVRRRAGYDDLLPLGGVQKVDDHVQLAAARPHPCPESRNVDTLMPMNTPTTTITKSIPMAVQFWSRTCSVMRRRIIAGPAHRAAPEPHFAATRHLPGS